MTFNEVIDAFMSSVEADKTGGTLVTYKRKILVFQEYVEDKLQAKEVNFQSILKAMTKEQLVNSLRYYVGTYEIKFVATVQLYITVIAAFFDFISNSYNWKNPLFENKTKYQELKMAYDDKISELGLNAKEQGEPLSQSEAKRLLNLCNDKIDNATIDKLINGADNGEFSAYISSLISKMVLLYGTKNSSIRKLTISDYDNILNKIRINGIWVHLPDQYAVQMNEYMKYREHILADEAEERLFVDIRKGKRKLDNNKMFWILKDVIGNNKGTSVAKFAIIEMIKLGIPAHIIKEFTGFSDDIYLFCQERSEQDVVL